MEKAPKISIIIPIFNGETFLGQCLDSLFSQTFDDFEVICLDDHSTDDSLKIISYFTQKEQRLKSIPMNRHFGQYFLRNRGIQIAKADYICFLDDDDFIDDDFLELLYKKITDTNADICLCGGDEYWDIEKEFRDVKWILNGAYLPDKQVFRPTDYPENIFQICGESPWARILKKDFVRKFNLRFDNLPVFEDFPFSIKCITLVQKISYVNEKLYHHRKHPGNASSQLWNRRVNFDAFLISKRFLQNLGFYEIVKYSFLNKCIYAINWRLESADNESICQKMLDELKNNIFHKLELIDEINNLSYTSKIVYHSIIDRSCST